MLHLAEYPEYVAVIVAEPADTPFTVPPETIATDESELVHDASPVTSDALESTPSI